MVSSSSTRPPGTLATNALPTSSPTYPYHHTEQRSHQAHGAAAAGSTTSLRLPSTSPFHDLGDLDEIISPEMRAAVRRTLAMKDMIAQHEAHMKKYTATRRRQQALTAALRARGIAPQTATGTQVAADVLLAASPSSLQALMTPSTALQVGALLDALRQELGADSSLASPTTRLQPTHLSSPGLPPPTLKLPVHLLAERRGVQFEASPATPPSAEAPPAGLAAQQEQQLPQLPPALVEASDEANASMWPPPYIYEEGEGPAMSLPSAAPMQTPFAGSVASAPAPDAASESQLLELLAQQWSPRHAAAASQPPGHIPRLASLPQPDSSALPSDRSLTVSDIMRVVGGRQAAAHNPMAYMHLKEQVVARHTRVYPPPSAVDAARSSAGPQAARQWGHQAMSPGLAWGQSGRQDMRSALLQAWPEAAAGQPLATAPPATSKTDTSAPATAAVQAPANAAPLAIQVLSCMATKAKGLEYVAQKRSRSPNIGPAGHVCDARQGNNAAPPRTSHCLPDRRRTAAATLAHPQQTAAGGADDGMQQASRLAEPVLYTGSHWQAGSRDTSPGLQAPQSSAQQQQQQQQQQQLPGEHSEGSAQQHRRHHHHRHHRHDHQTAQSTTLLPLSSNLSLSFLRGDRVPRPNSKQALPPEMCRSACSPFDTAVAAYVRQAHTAPCSSYQHGHRGIDSGGRCRPQSMAHQRAAVQAPGPAAGSLPLLWQQQQISAAQEQHQPAAATAQQGTTWVPRITAAEACLQLPSTMNSNHRALGFTPSCPAVCS